MNDTAPWAAKAMRELMAQRTPSERVAMASRSFAAARKLLIAGIRQQCPDISDEELRFRVLERTYRADFEPEAWARLVELWNRRSADCGDRGEAAAVQGGGAATV